MRGLALLAALVFAAPAGAASGTVILVPGSGFRGVGPKKEIRLSIASQHWNDWGFRTRITRYREGREGLRDVRAEIAWAVRERPDDPICIYGESSGGTLALVAAASEEASVRCIVISVSPTDQETWSRSDRSGALRLSTEVWPSYFGDTHEDDTFEPYDVWQAFEPAIPVFLIYAQGDPAIPVQQGKIFATLPADVTLRVLHKGARMFVHSKVKRSELLQVRGEARNFVSKAFSPPVA